jgi:alpha-tubulin suppressor-like RCC1 family protein
MGNLFSMGKGEHGELGLGKDKIVTNSLIKIKSLYDNSKEVTENKIKFTNCYAGMRSSFATTGNNFLKLLLN